MPLTAAPLDDSPYRPDEAWPLLQHIIDYLLGFFGGLAGLLSIARLNVRDHRRFSKHVRVVEIIARRMLAVLAAEYGQPGLRAGPSRPRATTAQRPRLDPRADADPANWRVPFRLVPSPSKKRRRRRRRARHAPAARRIGLRGLAARIRAVQRVIAAPTGYAMRLARRLARTPDKAALIKRLARAPHGRLDGYETELARSRSALAQARRIYDST